MRISSCIHVATNALFHPLYGQLVFRCIYVPYLLYPFICGWTFRLIPCHGYSEYHCYEHRGCMYLFEIEFVWIYAQEWDC